MQTDDASLFEERARAAAKAKRGEVLSASEALVLRWCEEVTRRFQRDVARMMGGADG